MFQDRNSFDRDGSVFLDPTYKWTEKNLESTMEGGVTSFLTKSLYKYIIQCLFLLEITNTLVLIDLRYKTAHSMVESDAPHSGKAPHCLLSKLVLLLAPKLFSMKHGPIWGFDGTDEVLHVSSGAHLFWWKIFQGAAICLINSHNTWVKKW